MTELAASLRGSSGSVLERYFHFAAHGTTLARDTMAGATTFIVMSYIIFLNPAILSFAGVQGLERIRACPSTVSLTATCLVAGVMTIAMGLYTNRAYAIAPGLGINAIVAFQLVATEGLSFPAAMGLDRDRGHRRDPARHQRHAREDHACDPSGAEEGDRDRHRSFHRVHRAGTTRGSSRGAWARR